MATEIQRELVRNLNDTIQTLSDAAIDLKGALIHRRVDEIWEILTIKEEYAQKLESYISLWDEIVDKESSDEELQAIRRDIKEKVFTLHELETHNASLSRSYLASIRKALNEVSDEHGQKATYNKDGKSKQNNHFIVRQFG